MRSRLRANPPALAGRDERYRPITANDNVTRWNRLTELGATGAAGLASHVGGDGAEVAGLTRA